MHEIHPKILTDDQKRPIAVQIDYADWLEIQKRLGQADVNGGGVNLTRFTGALKRGLDGLVYQKHAREEWGR
jgi:hypothetical protein